MRGSGGGRPKKPPGTTVHRNAPVRHDITVAANARVETVPAPSLPLVGRQLDLWASLWGEPVAVLWARADVQAITRLVVLATSAQALMDPRLLAEMRHLEDRFLLNPYARAQQRVVIVEAEPEEESAEPVSHYAHLRALHGGRQTG